MEKKKVIFAILGVVLMVSGIFSLIAYIPASSETSPTASPACTSVTTYLNTAYLNTSVSYWVSKSISNSTTTDVQIPIDKNSSDSQYSFGSNSSWSLSSNEETASWTQSFSGAPNYVYLGSDQYTLVIDSLAFELGDSCVGLSGSETTYQELGTVYANMTIGGYTETWSYTFDFNKPADSYYAIITPEWNFFSETPWYLLSDASTATLTVTVTGDGYPYAVAPTGIFTTIVDQGQNVIASSIATTVYSVPFADGYHYGSTTSSFTPAPDLTCFVLSASGPFSSTQFTYAGNTVTNSSALFQGVIQSGSKSVTFGVLGDPSQGELTSNTYYVTGSYYLDSQVQAQEMSTAQFYSSSQNPTENQNWWNSTSSFKLIPPSGAINNPSLATTSGTINAVAMMTWNISHIFSVGYGTSPAFDRIFYSGSNITSSSFVPSAAYNTISQGNAVAIDVNTTVSYDFDEFVNYLPSIANSHVLTPINPFTPISIYANATEQISGENQNIAVSPQGRTYTSSVPTTPESLVSPAFYFHSTGQKTIDWYVHNDPNGDPYPGSAQNTSIQTATTNVVPFSLSPSPVDYSSVGTSVLLSLTYNTQTTAKMAIINLTVNGILEDRFQPDLSSGTVKYDFKQPVSAPLLVTWQAVDQYGYSQSITFQYGSNLTPAEYSNKVTVLQAPNSTYSYPISLSGVPTGNGSYQQLITINNPSKYGINTAGSNIEFTASNGTLLYAWIQSINSSAIQVWVKNFNSSSTVDMQVLPSFENLFSPTGYLGEAPQLSSIYAEYDNGAEVFADYINNNSYDLYMPNSTTSTTIDYTFPAITSGEILYNGYIGSLNSIGNNFILLASDSYSNFYRTGSTSYYAIYSNGAGAGSAVIDNQVSVNTTINMEMNVSTNSSYVSLNQNNAGWTYFPTGYTFSSTSSVYIQNSVTNTYSDEIYGHYIAIAQFGPDNIMPSFTIGTGSVFQANATTTSTFSGTPTGNYNATYSIFTYDVPIAPSTSYVSIMYNSSWVVSNIYPSTYLPLIPGTNFITVEDVKGFSSIQVSFIEPSQQIGSTTYQSIQYQLPNGINAPVDYFTNSIVISPFGSSKSTTERTTSQMVEIPYGSTVTINVFDPWGDLIGSISNFLVSNLTGEITIPVDVTEIHFEFFNSTENYVYLSRNGINESFFNSAIVANNTQFHWATEYYSVSSGDQEFKSGTIATGEAIQPLLIYLSAPRGQLQIEVSAYSGSNLGTVSNSGNPRVLSFIDGMPYIIGSTYTGYQGSTYEIRIADLLNQTLLETNVTLQSSFTSLTETITTPSYWMGIENDEQIPQNSPLATEYISLNRTGSDKYYNFTDSVGQNWKGYFLAGNYTIHMHDNVTNTFFVNISKSNQQYYLNGQALLNLTDFDKKINKLLNYTKSVENTTYGLRLVPSSSSVSVLTDQKATFSWNVYYQNYTDFPSNYLKNSTVFVQIRNSTGAVQSFAANTTVSGNSIIYTATPTISGYFTVSIDALYGKYAGSSSQVLQVSSPQKVSVGMSVSFGIAQSLDTNKSYVVPIYLLYGNGTRFNLSDTGNAFPYATLYILQGNTVVHTYAPVNYSAGTIDFDIAPLSTGQYTFYASVSQFNLSGSPVHAAITQTETVQPPVLSALGQFEAFWEEIGHGLVANLLYTIIGTIAILVGAWALRKFIKWIRGDKATDAKITNQILANAIQKIQRPYDNLAQVLPIFMSLEYSEQSAFLLASHEVLRLREITIGKKKSNLEKVRDYIVKVKRQPDGESLLEKIEKRFASKNKK